MADIFVKTGEVSISNRPDDVIKTVLGSCVALILLAPKTKTIGLAHIALPDSSIDTDDEQKSKWPGYFANEAVPYMINEFKKYGVRKSSDVIIKMAGGAKILDSKGTFNIGKRNILATRKNLWKNRLAAISEDIGEDFSRKVHVDVKTGRVIVSSPGKGEWEL